MFIIGPIVKKINLARFSRILSSMLKSGVPIVDGLQVASETVGNSYYQGVIKQASSSVRQGKPLTEVLEANQNLFPFILVQMLLVGEETGSLENILSQLAVQYEGEVDSTMRNLSSVIEPILLLVIGGLVGILALALIAPIYNISQSIG
jgi:type IV pilus assembly protein PilC